MRNLFRLFPFLLTILLATMGTVTGENGMKEYQSPMGFTISVPASWEIIESNVPGDECVAFFENDERRLIVITSQGGIYRADDRISYIEGLKNEIVKRVGEAKLIYTDELEVDGYGCSHIQYLRNGAIRDVYYVSGNGIFANIAFYDDLKFADHILKSFRFSIPGTAVDGNTYLSELGYRFEVQKEWRMIRIEEDMSDLILPSHMTGARQETIFLYMFPKTPAIVIGASAHDLYTEYGAFDAIQTVMNTFRSQDIIVDEGMDIVSYNSNCFVCFSVTSPNGQMDDVYVCSWAGIFMTISIPSETPENVREYLLGSLVSTT